jgi:hypothetical protein
MPFFRSLNVGKETFSDAQTQNVNSAFDCIAFLPSMFTFNIGLMDSLKELILCPGGMSYIVVIVSTSKSEDP